MSVVTLVVADDHPIVRHGLISLIEADPGLEVIAEASDGQGAIDLTLALRPTAVIMDLRMPGIDGVEATARIKSGLPEAIILILTTYDTDEAIVRAVEAGASGYLLKDTDPAELRRLIHQAVAGETVLSPPVAKRLVDRVRNTETATLSAREIEVIRLVAAGNTNATIAAELHISQATVKTHLVRIYEKYGVSDRAAAVARAFETGTLSL